MYDGKYGPTDAILARSNRAVAGIYIKDKGDGVRLILI